MFTEQKLNRLQWVLLGVFAGLCLLYVFGYRALSDRAERLDQPLASAWERLESLAREAPVIQSIDREEMLRTLLGLEQAGNDLKAVSEMTRRRLDLDPAARAKIDEPFHLLDFEKQRVALIAELRATAGRQKVTLDPAVAEGYPDYIIALSEPALLWPQLSMVHQALTTIVLQQPRAIQRVTVMPRRAHYLENRITLEEFPVRIELRGSADSALQILRALPLLSNEMTNAGLPEIPGHKQALFIDRFLVKNSTNALHEVEMDLLISGFMDRTDTLQ